MKTQSLVLYHGTDYHDEIKRFWPNSHFGSKSASIDAIAAKTVDRVETENRGDVPDSFTLAPDPRRRIIEVGLSYDISDCLTSEDWGNPNTLALSDLLRKTSGFEELFMPIYSDLFAYKKMLGQADISREQRIAALRRHGEPLVCAALESKGIKVIKYRNVVEGKSEDGEYEYSYCVFAPGLLDIRQSYQVGNSDLLEGVKRVLKSRYKSRTFDVSIDDDCVGEQQ